MVPIKSLCESWEPTVLTLEFGQQTPPSDSVVESICFKWFQGRAVGCPCQFTFLKVIPCSANSVQILAEWLCTNCLPDLVRYLDERVSGLAGVTLGVPLSASPAVERAGEAMEFVRVAEKQVEFENGSVANVAAFDMTWHPVTVAQFKLFAESTGHLTTAERQGGQETYASNITLEPLSPAERKLTPVSCVSFVDAVTCATWFGGRLPTEAEWLAGAIAEPRILDEQDFKQQRFWQKKEKQYLQRLGAEWTATFDPSGKIVVRAGPKWARTVKWKAHSQRHRILAAPETFDVNISFRIVRHSRS